VDPVVEAGAPKVGLEVPVTPAIMETTVALLGSLGRVQTMVPAPRQVGVKEGQATLTLAAAAVVVVETTFRIRGDLRQAAAVVDMQVVVVEDLVPATPMEVAQEVEVVAPRGLVPSIFLVLQGSSRFQAGTLMVKERRVARAALVPTVLVTPLHPVETTTDI
jgi:hypothetical protein